MWHHQRNQFYAANNSATLRPLSRAPPLVFSLSASQLLRAPFVGADRNIQSVQKWDMECCWQAKVLCVYYRKWTMGGIVSSQRMRASHPRLNATLKCIPALVLPRWAVFTSSKSAIRVLSLLSFQRSAARSWVCVHVALCQTSPVFKRANKRLHRAKKTYSSSVFFYCACLVFWPFCIFNHVLTSSRAASPISHGYRPPLFVYRWPWVPCVYHSFPAVCLPDANGDPLLWLGQICCFDGRLCGFY